MGEAFQEASQLDCVVFDKTGTLTQGGAPAVTEHSLDEIPGKGMRGTFKSEGREAEIIVG